MSTRRDELSAHTFARKRMLAAFLQPEARVSDEEAPRPVRAFMPSAVMSVVLVAGCIAWGAISPSAPPGWDEPGKYIIVDSDSTTRYVVLTDKEDGKKVKQLHPVLNFASAKLVLDKGKGEVIEVSGEDIDESDIVRGATIGIPYAPDRLPDKKDAETAKEWAMCEKPGPGGKPQQGVFVLGGQDKDALKGKNRLGDREALYVQGPEGKRYLVDGNGTKLLLDGGDSESSETNRDLLTKLALKNPGDPQQVSEDWLDTLQPGAPISFPTTLADPGTPVGFDGFEALPTEARHVGAVLKTSAGGASYYYVVLENGVRQTTPFYAQLMMGGVGQQDFYSTTQLRVAKTEPNNDIETGGKGWPQHVMDRANREAQGIGSTSHTVSCSVYTGDMAGGRPKLAAWAGHDFPANIVNGSSRAYVSPGTGLLYQEHSGTGGGGRQYLLTDSGLRYAVDKKSKTRLGFAKAKVAHVPKTWSDLLPKGPRLNSKSASQEQGM